MILESLYLILPGVLANMAPVLCRKIQFLNAPVDFGKMWKGKLIFGKNKTYRGFFFGILFAVGGVLLQRYLYRFVTVRETSLIDYSAVNPYLLGFFMGFGVLFGDLVKSFFKRRLDIKPGASWFPFDQLDALIGGLLFTSIMYTPPMNVIVFLLVFVPVLHVGVNYLGYLMGLKEAKL